MERVFNKKINWKDPLVRAGKTFVQTFISTLGIDSLMGVTNFAMFKKALFAVVISAGASGICAVWNLILEWINTKVEDFDFPSDDKVEDSDFPSDDKVEDSDSPSDDNDSEEAQLLESKELEDDIDGKD